MTLILCYLSCKVMEGRRTLLWTYFLCVAAATAQFILLPGVPIQMGTLLPVLMGADILGVLLGWRYLLILGQCSCQSAA